MTSSLREPFRTLAIVTAAIALTAAWLWYGPSFAADIAGDATGVMSEALFTVIVFAPLLAAGLAGLAGGAVSGIAAWRPGDDPMRAAGLGAALGLGGLLLAAGYAALAGTLGHGAGGGISFSIVAGLVVIGLQVAAEEIMFRGWLQPRLARATGTPIAVGGIAFAFAALHLVAGASGAIALLNLLLGGLLFGALAARDGGIAGAFAAHFAWNATEQLGIGLDPNPGIGSFGAIVDLDMIGHVRWGGSAEGLNASWAMAIALFAVLVPLVLSSAAKRGEVGSPLSPSLRRPI